MEITGIVEDIIFKNSDNGYTVLSIDYNGDYTTCVGKTMSVNVGESVKLTGEFVKNAKFGEQFAFSYLLLLVFPVNYYVLTGNNSSSAILSTIAFNCQTNKLVCSLIYSRSD